MIDRVDYLRNARAKYDAYDPQFWTKGGAVRIGKRIEFVVGFVDHTGGYAVVHKGHKFDLETGKFEIKTVNILAYNGYQIEMMDESNFEIPQYDINVNGFPTEIKVMSGFRNIHKRAEEASYQGAKRIVYYIKFDNEREMFKRFVNVYKTIENIDEIWYIKDDKLHYFKK